MNTGKRNVYPQTTEVLKEATCALDTQRSGHADESMSDT